MMMKRRRIIDNCHDDEEREEESFQSKNTMCTFFVMRKKTCFFIYSHGRNNQSTPRIITTWIPDCGFRNLAKLRARIALRCLHGTCQILLHSSNIKPFKVLRHVRCGIQGRGGIFHAQVESNTYIGSCAYPNI